MKAIEEKTRAYDEANYNNYKSFNELIERLEIVKNAIKENNYGIAMDILCKPYPEFQITTSAELVEPEYEKTRKALIKGFNECIEDAAKNYSPNMIKYWHGIEVDSILAWLEKQGEQKPADKDEPKFLNGQWIVWQNKCYKVNYNGCGYELIDQNGLRTSLEYGTVDKSAHLWTIQDAKDGDVLQLGEVTAIFKKSIGNEHCICYCSFYKAEGFEIPIENGEDNSYGCYNATPATKEQRDLLFNKMKEAGYEWNAENKELKKIENKNPMLSDFFKAEYERGKADAQKFSWSEEDENEYVHILKTINLVAKEQETKGYNNLISSINWFKSLKDKVQPKQEWSGEDIEMLNSAISFVEHSAFRTIGKGKNNVIAWLKSLKEKIRKV